MSKVYKPKHQHPAHLPHVPKPPSQDKPAVPETAYSESETVTDTIAGTNLKFGTEKKVEVLGNRARDYSSTINQSLGTGKLISRIEDVYGVCIFCKAEADKAYKKNRITLKEAQAKSFYDTLSAVTCQGCGLNTCSRHTRRIQMPDGTFEVLCKDCQRRHKRKWFFKQLFLFLITPFLEKKNNESAVIKN